MRLGIVIFSLIALVFVFGGCENLCKNTRQTGKNISAVFLDGYHGDLYESR